MTDQGVESTPKPIREITINSETIGGFLDAYRKVFGEQRRLTKDQTGETDEIAHKTGELETWENVLRALNLGQKMADIRKEEQDKVNYGYIRSKNNP